MNTFSYLLGLFAITSILTGCHSNAKEAELNSSDSTTAFNSYWYNGEAELSSYTLEQARYGELYEGEVVLIYVTEDFSAGKHVKLDNPNSAGNDKVPVLKLNTHKTFNTGLYPYSVYTSTFMPVDLNEYKHALKVSTSVQDWCGHAFYQINNRDENLMISSKSYFESEGDREFELPINYLEDELWNIIRLNPDNLPQGKLQLVPSTAFARLKHVELKTYEASASLKSNGDNYVYHISYPPLNRDLEITFSKDFPYQIQGWQETYTSGWGLSAKKLTTKATLNKTLVTDYWTKNSPSDEQYRTKLGIKK